MLSRTSTRRKFLIDPRRQQVTYYWQVTGTQGAFIGYPVPNAVPKVPTRDQVVLAGGTLVTETWKLWQLGDDELIFKPKVGDYLVDGAGVSWQVKSMASHLFENIHQPICYRGV